MYYQQKDNKIVVTAVKNSVGEPDDLVWVMFGLPQYACLRSQQYVVKKKHSVLGLMAHEAFQCTLGHTSEWLFIG